MLEQMQRTGDKCCGGDAVCVKIANDGDMFVGCEPNRHELKRYMTVCPATPEGGGKPTPYYIRAGQPVLLSLCLWGRDPAPQGDPRVPTPLPAAPAPTRCVRNAEERAPRRC